MPLTPPSFWSKPESSLSVLLEPLSWLYQAGSHFHRMISKPYRAPVPVISIGNFVLGGAGKTPFTCALAQTLEAMGKTPHIISRGYGGALKGPLQVDLDHHSFHQVGDEPLLLAKTAPTWVSRNRRDAVHLAVEAGADLLLLDDAHQNYSLEKDISFMVVNAAQGFGNGQVFPAGPLRQSLSAGLKTTSALIFIGGAEEPLPASLTSLPCPLIRANVVPVTPKPEAVLAFTGIGYPEKFRQTLTAAGYDVKAFYSYPDHYPYTEKDVTQLKREAQANSLLLMTTEKDAVRLPLASRQDILVLPIELAFDPPSALEDLLKLFLKG